VHYSILAGAIAGLSALGWYLSKKTEKVVDWMDLPLFLLHMDLRLCCDDDDDEFWCRRTYFCS
jgi:hypothetical protein